MDNERKWRKVEPTWCYERRPNQNCHCDLSKGHNGEHQCHVCNVAWASAAVVSLLEKGDQP